MRLGEIGGDTGFFSRESCCGDSRLFAAVRRLNVRIRSPAHAPALVTAELDQRRFNRTVELLDRLPHPLARQAPAAHDFHVVATGVYRQMLRLLELRGHRKGKGATPLEFARTVSRESENLGAFVQPLTEYYCRTRFGSVRTSPEDVAQAARWLAGLAAAGR